MTNDFQRATNDVNKPLWWIGWHGKYTVVGVTILAALVGEGLGAPVVLGMLGFFAAPILWYVGVRHINENYENVLNAYQADVYGAAENLLSLDDEDDVSKYAYGIGSGSKFLREPALEYSNWAMLVTDYSATIHDDANLDMVSLQADIGNSTEEIYYDTVASVNYDADEKQFWINRTDGRGHWWPSEREPEDALDDIQRRVRAYKRGKASS